MKSHTSTRNGHFGLHLFAMFDTFASFTGVSAWYFVNLCWCFRGKVRGILAGFDASRHTMFSHNINLHFGDVLVFPSFVQKNTWCFPVKCHVCACMTFCHNRLLFEFFGTHFGPFRRQFGRFANIDFRFLSITSYVRLGACAHDFGKDSALFFILIRCTLHLFFTLHLFGP